MLLIFGGTTEGRLAVEVCEEAGKPFYYSTKGNSQKVEMHNGVRLTGVMTTSDIISFAKEHHIRCIIDAAHPFAENLHHTIEATSLPVIRLQRSFSERQEGITYCKDYADAIGQLKKHDITKLLALSGANTIARLRPYWKEHTTLFRILDREESITQALAEGLHREDLLLYSHRPSKEEEKEMMILVGCDAIITKDSGETGGFMAKVQAAIELGIRVFVIERPALPEQWTYVFGRHAMRRAIQHHVPEFFPLKTGLTTGACATAATKAALLSLLYGEQPEEIAFTLPDDEMLTIPVTIEGRGVASVTKDYSDDPDVTKGCRITSRITKSSKGDGITFLHGEGVGTVTLPGLGIPVGEPAINPTPRHMIENEIRSISHEAFHVTISVENGEEIAKRTFNAKVGVIGGISIIGTSGIVSPLSNDAFIQSIGREFQVAKAIGCHEIGIVSGKKGETALKKKEPHLRIIHYGNFVGETLKQAYALGFNRVVIGIMIGKAVKLAEGNLDTHSHKVQMNKAFLKIIAGNDSYLIDNIVMARELWDVMPPSFFDRINNLCYQHCRKVFPDGELEIQIFPHT